MVASGLPASTDGHAGGSLRPKPVAVGRSASERLDGTGNMGRTPDRIRLAEHLLELAAAQVAAEDPVGAGRDPAAIVCDRLAAVLTTFTGATGSGALLRRALAIATAQEPRLAAVEIGEDGLTSGLASLDGEARRRAGDTLVAALLDLLSDLIGEALLRRLAAQAWPESIGFVRETATEDNA